MQPAVMAFAMIRLFPVALGVALASSDDADQGLRGVTAIKKVILMMEDMQANAKKDKADEHVAFAKFSEWCKYETAKIEKSIKKESSDIEGLGTSIQKRRNEAKKLGQNIKKLYGSISKHEANMKARTATRAKERGAYEEQSADYAESISAIERATVVMKAQSHDRKGSAASLLQISQTSRMPDKAKDVIAAFLGYDMSEDSDDYKIVQPPKANAYEANAGMSSTISLLDTLLGNFKSQKNKCDKEEAAAKHSHDMVMQDLKEAVDDAERDVSSTQSTKATHEEKVAISKGQEKSTKEVRTGDAATLKDVQTECTQKKLSFDAKQEMRGDEIEAIGKAIGIMSSKDVASFIESAAVVGRRLMTGPVITSLAQLRVQGRRYDVRAFIGKESRRLKSHVLSLLAERLEADPFVKVKELLKSMVARLLQEASEDAQHAGFCSKEMAKSKYTRTRLTETIEALSASIEDKKSEIFGLTESNAELAKGIKDIDSAVGEATKMRSADSKRNAETVKDSKAAVTAIDAATGILKDFYMKASRATALVQDGTMGEQVTRMGSAQLAAPAPAMAFAPAPAPGPAPAAYTNGMQTFGDAFKGNQDGADGVLAMIDVIRSDFADLAADARADEASDIKAFQEMKTQTRINKVVKAKKLQLNEADKAEATKKMMEDSKDFKSNQDSLTAAGKYFEKLQEQCVAKSSSFDERSKARAEEIQSLKEAMEMLAKN